LQHAMFVLILRSADAETFREREAAYARLEG